MNQEITAIIVEDIKDFHSVIELLLKDVAPHVKIVGKATTLAKAEMLIKQQHPNLVFLDIQFETEGKTAFDLLMKLEKQNRTNFQIIIITAFNQEEYYAEAFNYGALHYLTKPIDKQKLKEAIERVNTTPNLTSGDWVTHFSKFHMQLHSERNTKITIEGIQYTELIDIKDIVYLEASGHYTFIYILSGRTKPICSTTNIGKFEQKLANHPRFFRINRNLIINTDFVERYSKKDCTIVLSAPYDTLRAARDRFKDFIQLMDTQTNEPKTN